MRPAPTNAFKRKLVTREKQLGFWLSLNSLAATEIAAGAGFDWVLLDMEHSSLNVETVEQHLLAARHGGDAEFIVRIPSVDAVLVKRLLDAGVRSFMYPNVQTLEEAQLAVAATRYPPQGIRGVSGNHRANRFTADADYPFMAHESICVILQVETLGAVANIPRYAAIEGVDGIFVGPNDLAASMGHLAKTGHPEVVAKVTEACDLILAGGKAAGMLDFNTANAQPLLAQGFSFLAVASDLSMLVRGTKSLLAEVRRPPV
jgi:4-hydroxy-2-oxoheptanedioate aldolase